MSRSFVCLLTLSAGLLMASGCGDDAPPAAPATQPSAPPPPPPSAIEVGTPTSANGALPPPPGVTRSIADLPAASGAAAPSSPAVNPAGSLESLVNPGNVFFYDKDDVFLPKDAVDFLQRAVQNYMNERKYQEADDSQGWPMMTDLSLLVQYKIIRALPAPPAGQKFVLDPQTRKVSLAPQ